MPTVTIRGPMTVVTIQVTIHVTVGQRGTIPSCRNPTGTRDPELVLGLSARGAVTPGRSPIGSSMIIGRGDAGAGANDSVPNIPIVDVGFGASPKCIRRRGTTRRNRGTVILLVNTREIQKLLQTRHFITDFYMEIRNF